MQFMYHKAEMVIDTINKLISINYPVVTTKIIKAYNDIPKEDRSLNNFIWRNLEILEKAGIIELIKRKPFRKYKLPREIIKLEEVENQCKTLNPLQNYY